MSFFVVYTSQKNVFLVGFLSNLKDEITLDEKIFLCYYFCPERAEALNFYDVE